MNLKTSLNFSINKVSFEEAKESRFSKAVIHAFADGHNAHTWPISTEVLKRSSHSIYDIPILCKYSEFVDDFLGHEEDEVPIGFIKEDTNTYKNPIIFEKAEDGRTFIVIKGLIWNKYSGNAIEVLKRDDMKKSVSVEIEITKGQVIDEKIQVEEFVLNGITVLGDFVTPAVKDANILLEFSKDKKYYLSKFADSKIQIDNSKEKSVSGVWKNPRRKLFVPISNASNSKELLKEAYLLNDGSYENPEISKMKYPHHVIKDGILVVHKDGLEAAFKRAKQQNIFEGKVKEHILRHYKELGLSKDNFETFGIKEEDFSLYFSNSLSEESVGETTMQNELKDIYGFEDKNVECAETEMKCEEDVKCAEETVECEDVKCEDEVKCEEETCQEDVNCAETEVKCEDDDADDSEDKDDEEVEKDEDDKETDEDVEKEMSFEEAKAKIAEMSETITKLQSENTAYMARIQEMSDYEDLKKFKADTIEKEKREEEMSKMEKVMSEIESRGVAMTEDEKAELMSKFGDFESMDAWSNFVKAQVFDKCENVGFMGFALPFTEKKTESVWDRI